MQVQVATLSSDPRKLRERKMVHKTGPMPCDAAATRGAHHERGAGPGRQSARKRKLTTMDMHAKLQMTQPGRKLQDASCAKIQTFTRSSHDRPTNVNQPTGDGGSGRRQRAGPSVVARAGSSYTYLQATGAGQNKKGQPTDAGPKRSQPLRTKLSRLLARLLSQMWTTLLMTLPPGCEERREPG